MKSANINHFLVGLIHKKGIKKQFIFSKNELNNNGYTDPLGEHNYEVVPDLIHRYPDRAVLTVTNKCFAYCRFCFRKRNWDNFVEPDLAKALEYLKEKIKIHEMIISGGDPFTLSDIELENIISALKTIKHIYSLRISSRVLSVYPERVSLNTVRMLKKYRPIWFVAHINHPDEITEEFKKKTQMILDNGIPMVSQTVLLRGINDNHITLKKLFCNLVRLGIKPYYLFGCDQAKGNKKFRVSIEKAMSIVSKLKGNISGLCMPFYSFDLPGGGGKVTVEPNQILRKNKNIYTFRNFEGKEFTYEDI